MHDILENTMESPSSESFGNRLLGEEGALVVIPLHPTDFLNWFSYRTALSQADVCGAAPCDMHACRVAKDAHSLEMATRR